MSDPIKMEAGPPPRRRGRGCVLGLGLFAVAVLGLLLAGAVYESAAEAADERAYPPPGQLVDVGGHRLHIHCTGTGSPVVVIDAGWGDWSTIWGLVQPEVAKTTRVCTYDRAGMGWSEPGPLPRDARQFAKELQALLKGAGIPPPYVIVGHSLGGLTARVFAHDAAAEVAGVVLLDSMTPGQFNQAAADAQDKSGTTTPAFAGLAILARFGAMRLFAKLPGMVPADLPGAPAYLARYVRPQYWQSYLDEGQAMPASGAQAAAVTSLGDLPLIVLSRGLDNDPPWPAQQAELLQLSSNSQQLIADKSGHTVELDQPEAAVAAIVQMVTALRRR